VKEKIHKLSKKSYTKKKPLPRLQMTRLTRLCSTTPTKKQKDPVSRDPHRSGQLGDLLAATRHDAGL
jgi:hypothetical protein